MTIPAKVFDLNLTKEVIEKFRQDVLKGKRPKGYSDCALELLGSAILAPEAFSNKKECLIVIPGAYFETCVQFGDIFKVANNELRLRPTQPEDAIFLRDLASKEIGFDHLVMAHPPVLVKTENVDAWRLLTVHHDPGLDPVDRVGTVILTRLNLAESHLVFRAM